MIQPPQHADPNADNTNSDNKSSVVRLSICALGICVCYMYYGIIQEKMFSKQKIGPSFVLLIQCVTNSMVAKLWQWLDQWMTTGSSSSPRDEAAAKKKNDDLDTAKTSPATTTDRLHHPLLLATALCYVSAMVCSNEALHYVSYPTAVLAKSCKLIPTMAMGVLVEHKIYQWIEWMAALCITLGIVIFNFSRITSSGDDQQEDDEDSSWVGLTLLSTSLIMDGFLGSCQGLLKNKRTLLLPNQKPGQAIVVRPPNAVETMLFVNLYAIIYLIPLTILNQQMAEGLAMLQGRISSSVDTEEDHEGSHKDLLVGLLVINATVAAGQIFIFLTITWYSSLICTTITTTRKFFTILLSVLYFGHHFTILQWAATGLVFSGLYLGIMGQRSKSNSISEQQQQQQPHKISSQAPPQTSSSLSLSSAPLMSDFSTTHLSPRRSTLDASKSD